MELLARLLEETDRRVWAPVRASDDAEAATRLRAALATLVPDPDAHAERVVAFAADLTQPRLGIDARRRDEIAEHVDEIVHTAASVSFTLPLGEALRINVFGTLRMLELAELCECPQRSHTLRHVSTAYVAGDHRGRFSEADHDVGQRFNNTYERSKWEAERLVRGYADRVPVQIFRPSIVVGDEQSGWTASFNVIYKTLRAYARGALPLIPEKRSAPVDVVPVGYVARSILALADAGAGRTFQLVAGPEASSVGELIDRTVSHFGGRRSARFRPGSTAASSTRCWCAARVRRSAAGSSAARCSFPISRRVCASSPAHAGGARPGRRTATGARRLLRAAARLRRREPLGRDEGGPRQALAAVAA